MKLLAGMIWSFAALLAGTATAQGASFSGGYPLTITRSIYWNGTYCLTLTDDGSLGWPHSGEALLQGNEVYLSNGTFQVINRTLMVSIGAPGGRGNETLIFVASSHGDNPTVGEFEEVEATASDTGKIMFGAKGVC